MSKIRKYFGMDGVCGMVGEFLIIFEFVLKLGWVVGCVLLKIGIKKVIIGKDICILGYMLEILFEVGLIVVGIDVVFLGFMLIFVVVYLI